VLVKVQVVVDGTDAHQRVVVAVNVVQEAGLGELLGAEPAAFLCALLEDRDLPAAARQVGSEGHPVVASPDDHRVVDCVGQASSPPV
jgi:hypothetical protein